jgi:hypothetical protein
MSLTAGDPQVAGRYGGMIGALIGGGGGGILGGFAWLLNPTADQAIANAALSRMEDTRAIGPLLLALQTSTIDPFARPAAGVALLRIAQKMHKDDETELTAQQRECLNRAIRAADPRRASDYLGALLVLAAKTGDSETLAAIEPLLSRVPANEREATALRMARESHSQLKARIERSRDSSTLLRSVSSAGDSLLRPAANTQTTDDQQLLRPAAD